MNSGLWAVDCSKITIQDCIFNYYRIQGVGIRCFAIPIISENYKIINNYFGYKDNYDPLDTSGGIVGLELIFGTSGGIVYGNHLTNNKHENCYPYWGWNGTYPNKYPKTLNPAPINPHAVPDQGDGAGIELSGYYSTPIPGSVLPENHIIISNNYADKNQVGIRTEQNSQNTTIVGNTTTNNIMYGIFIYSSCKTICNSNIITKNGRSGISIQDAPNQILPTNIQIISNRIEGMLTNDNGLEIRASEGCIITNNLFQDCVTGVALYTNSSGNYCKNMIINSNIYNNVTNDFFSDPLSTNSTILNSGNLSYVV